MHRPIARPLLLHATDEGARGTAAAGRLVAWVPDLLFGSKVVELFGAAGYEVVLRSELADAADEARDAVAIVADLTHEGAQRAEDLAAQRPIGVPVLACFAHVEPEVRAAADEAGLEQVVPRSRLVREGPALLAGLLEA